MRAFASRVVLHAAMVVLCLAGTLQAEDRLVGVLPVVGSTPGAQGAQFRTELQMTNRGSEPARGSLVYRDQNGSEPRTMAWELGPRATRSWPDVVAAIGTSGLGSMEIVVSEGMAPAVIARAFADGGEQGTRGVMVPLSVPGDAFNEGMSATLLVPGDLERFRFNAGARALDQGATLRIGVAGVDGSARGELREITLAANGFLQQAGAEFAGVALQPNDSVLIEVLGGSAILYGTTTDNRTNDPAIQIDHLINKPPVLVEQKLVDQPDGTVSIELTFTDPDGDPISLALRGQPQHGTLGDAVERAPGAFVIIYRPDEGHAPDRIVIVVTDGNGNTKVIIINIPGGRNRLPTANDMAVETREDAQLHIVLTGSDPDGDPLTFRIVSEPSFGTLTAITQLTPTTARVTYRPEEDFDGRDQFTFEVDDSRGGTDSAVVEITVNPVNDAPVAVADGYTLLEDQTLTVPAPGVLANDFDGEGSPLSAVLDAAPANGTLALAADGSFTYTPNANFHGADSFIYHASDGSESSAPVTVSLTVTPVNDAPAFSAGPVVIVLEDSGDASLAWATAISAGPLETQGLAFLLTGNTNPSLFSAGPSLAADGTLSFTPAPDANGSASLTVVLQDDGGTANGGVDTSLATTLTIEVTAVNDVPSFVPGSDVTVLEDSGAHSGPWATTISAGPADEAGQLLTFTAANDNNVLFAVQPSIDASGQLTFMPAPDAHGATTVTLTLADDGGTANGGIDTTPAVTFTITVTPVNDAPVFVAGADPTVLEDAGAQSLAGWATGISPGPNEAGQTVAFSVTANSNPALFSAAPAVSADGTLSFTPAADANGSATITLSLQDDGGTADGGVDTSTPATFTINVTAVNDAPTFSVGADVSVLEDSGAYAGPQVGSIVPGPADEAGQTLAFTVGNDNAALFAVQPAIDAAGNLTFTPAPDLSGTAVITVSAQDDGGTANGGVDTAPGQTFTLTVTAVNDAPSFTSGGNVAGFEDSAFSAPWASGVSAGPGETQGLTFLVTPADAAFFAVQPSVAADGTLTFTPAANVNGATSLTIALQDDGGTANGGVDTSGSVVITVTIAAVNDAPTFAVGSDVAVLEDSGPYAAAQILSIVPGPADEAGQTMTFTVSADTPGLFAVQPAIDAAGNLTFTPEANVEGFATITVSAQDDGGTANGGVNTAAGQTFTITITGVNDAPSFISGGDVTTNEDASHSAAWATALSAGPGETQGLTFNITGNTNAALFATGPAIAPDGTLSYTPAANVNGSADITVVLQDDGGTLNGGVDVSGPATFTITVNPVNDVPSFAAGGDVTVLEDSGAYSAPQVGSIVPGPADESGQTLTFTVTNGNNALFLVQPAISSTGVLTFTPTANFEGTATVTVSAQDDGGTANGGVDTTGTQTFTITVTGVNDAPSFTSGGGVASDEDLAYSAAWATAISAGPGETQGLTFNITGNTNPGLFASGPSIAADGTLTFTPAADLSGVATISVHLQDDGGTANGGINVSGSVDFTITVNAVNDPPVAAAQSLATDEDTPLLITLSASDVEGSSLTFNAPSSPSIGALGALSAPSCSVAGGVSTCTATVTYTPNADANGADSFTFTANDGTDDSTAATISITVNAVNDAPINTVPVAVQTVNEGTPKVFSAGTGNAISVSDLEAATVQVTLQGSSGTGAITLATLTNLTFAGGDGTADESMTFTGAIADVNAALEGMTYSSTVGYDGPGSITIVTNDLGATGIPGPQSDTDVITLLIQRPNDPPVNAVPGDQTVAEDGALTFASTNTIPNAISVSDPDAGAANIEVDLSVTSGTLTLGSLPITVTITGGADASAAMTLQGPIADLNTALEGLVFTPVADFAGSVTLTIVTDDLGESGFGGALTDTDTVTIDVTEVNDPPSFTTGGDVTVDEDSGAYSAAWATAISKGPASEAAQVLTFNVTNNTNTALFGAGPAIAADGTLSFTPAADAHGSASITVELQDDGGGTDTSAPVTFTIMVDSINDAPSFTKGTDQSVVEDAGAQSVAGWATALSAGPADESGQVLSFEITGNTNAALFSAGPAIAANGTLSYTPAANANGTATITVRIRDDGGTANGGVDASVTQTFTIEVRPVNDAPSFTPGGNVTVDEDSGAYSAAWATGISAGPANESGQTVAFSIVSVSDPTLFAAGVNVSSTGVLGFTPALNKFGSATVEVFLGDDGGVVDGGDNTSGSVTFTITINPINDAPVDGAVLDFWETFGNTQLVVDQAALSTPHVLDTTPATLGVLSDDSDPVESDPISVTGIKIGAVACGDITAPFTCTTLNGGTVVMESNGRFVYTPAIGFTGADSFSYVLTDAPAVGSPASVDVLVSLTVHEVIWYVNGGVAGGGDGSSTAPFNSFASLNALGGGGDLDAPSSYIFVHTSTVNGSLELENGQKLWGEGFGLMINRDMNGNGNTTLVAAGTAPTITTGSGSNATVWALANTTNGPRTGLEIRGLNITSTGASLDAVDITSANATSIDVVMSGLSLTSVADGIDVNHAGTGTLNATLTGITVTSATANGIDLNHGSAATGTVSVETVNVTTAGGAGVRIARTAGNLTIDKLSAITVSGNTTGSGIFVSGPAAFSAGALTGLTIGASGNGVAGYGIDLSSVSGTLAPSSLSVYADGGVGVRISGTGTPTTIFNTPASTIVVANGGSAVDLSSLTLGGSGFDTITSTNSSNFGVNLTGVAGTFTAGSGSSISTITAAATAFRVASSSANVTYNGTINVTQGTGVSLSTNTGTIGFTGVLTLSTGANPAFTASGGGTVTATNTASTLATTTATALNVSTTTIGAGGLKFRSIASNGGGNAGIVLNATGSSGGLTVGGNGGACTFATTTCTGGTIQNKTGAGILLTNTSSVNLSLMRVTTGGDDGIRGTTVSGLTLASCLIDGNGNALLEHGLDFSGLTGTATLTGTTVRGNFDSNARILNSSGNLNLTATTCTFSSNQSTSDGDGLLLEASGTANITANISGSTFSSHHSDHFQAAAVNSGVLNVTLTNNTLSGGHAAPLGQGITINAATGVPGYNGSVTYDLNGNTINGAISNAINVNLGTSAAGALFSGQIRNNLIGTAGTALSCSTQANAINVEGHGNGTHTASITGNQIRQCFDRGISINANDGGGAMNLTVTGNNVSAMNDTNGVAGTPREAFLLVAGATTTNVFGQIDSHAVCLNLSGNTLVGGAFKNGDIRVRQRFRTSIRLPGYGGSAFDTAAVVTFLQGANAGTTATATASDDVAVTTDGYFGGAACPTP